MRKTFEPNSFLYPMPVLIVGSYDEFGKPNAMNAAWGGIYDTNMVMVCLAQDHKTTDNIKKSGAFTLSFGTESTVVACDYVGIVSGNQVPNKLGRAGFSATRSSVVNAPLIDELPLTLECQLVKFNEDGICIGKIVSISAEESILGADGQIDRDLLKPICYDGVTHAYYGIGKKVGQAFEDGKKLFVI